MGTLFQKEIIEINRQRILYFIGEEVNGIDFGHVHHSGLGGPSHLVEGDGDIIDPFVDIYGTGIAVRVSMIMTAVLDSQRQPDGGVDFGEGVENQRVMAAPVGPGGIG